MTLRKSTAALIAVWCSLCIPFAIWETASAQQHSIAPSAPPPPLAIETQCLDGETVVLILRSSTRSIQQLKFLIRKEPTLGTLSEPRILDRTSAMVEYTHDPERGTGIEEITYAVQAPNTAVSAPSKIQIIVRMPPPILQAEPVLAFGDVPVGESASKPLTLANTGGSSMTVRLQPDPPWEFEGESSFTLEPGESATTHVLFRPTEVRPFSQTIPYEGAPDNATLQLSGTGIAPFTLSPQELALSIDSKGETRSGVAVLSNFTSDPLTLTLHTDESLEIPSRVEIPANGKADILITVKPDRTAGVDTTLEARSETFLASVQVKAFPAPPKVVSRSGESVDFGHVQKGRLYRRHIQLTNVGGAPARLGVAMPDGVHILPDPESVTIPAGQTETFEVLFEPRKADGEPRTIFFSYGARSLPITLLSTLDEEAQPEVVSRPKPTPRPAPVKIESTEFLSGIPQIEKIWTRYDKRTVFISWKLPAPDAFKFIIEERHIKLVGPQRKPILEWRRIPAKIDRRGDTVEAMLQNIRPGAILNLRIISEDPLGYLSEPSPNFRIEVPIPSKTKFPLWISILVVVAGLVLYRRRRRRMEMERLDAETSRIMGRI